MFSIKRVNSGGIIPVYRCPAACRHCLYNCSNHSNGDYCTKEQAESLCSSLESLGCGSAHVGGGEPFLNFERLLELLTCMGKHRIQVDYIETNAAWCAKTLSDEKIIHMLSELKRRGASCLLISVDPFHVEFVPLAKPIRLINLCRKAGMDYFVWKEGYLRTLSGLDQEKTYSREELEAILGKDYILETAKQYGLTVNGRALKIAREFSERKPHLSFKNTAACSCLLNVNHYHADLNGYFIPPGCTGLGVQLQDLKSILPERYPIFVTLASKGVWGLFEFAQGFGFEAATEGYVSQCDFCYELRKFLLPKAYPDLYPLEYYAE